MQKVSILLLVLFDSFNTSILQSSLFEITMKYDVKIIFEYKYGHVGQT